MGAFTKKPIYFTDDIFDEKGSSFLAMRLTQWCEQGEEPDKEKAKLELRKFRMTSDGERVDKGFSFLTEDGPNELAHLLVCNGYGDTKELLLELRKRDNIEEALKGLVDDTVESVKNLFDNNDGEYFDMRSVLLDDSD